MLTATLAWGTVAGVIHFAVMGALYGNPWIDRLYRAAAAARAPGVRRWDSRWRYMLTQFAGTQAEVYVLALAYFWLRSAGVGATPIGVLQVGALLAAVRVYPRFWNMWIQSTYPRSLLIVELVNGTLGTFVVVCTLSVLVSG
jgi:hypothetical protein